MRRLPVALSALLAVLALPGAARATTWGPPEPLPGSTAPLAIVPAPGGGELVLRGIGPHNPYAGAADTLVTIQRVAGDGALGKLQTLPGEKLLRERPTAGGGADLLLFAPVDRPGTYGYGTLRLARVSAAGRVTTLWRSGKGATTDTADLGRDAHGRLALAWFVDRNVRVVTSRDGTRFSAAHTLRERGAKRAVDVRSILALAVALRPGGDPVVALTEYDVKLPAGGRTRVLTASAAGTVTRTQRFDGVIGLPQLVATPGGRLGLVVHDTGIEGDFGECVADGHPRRISATTAEPGSGRFRPMTTLNEQTTYCEDGGAPVLMAGLRDQLIVAFGAVPSTARTGTPPSISPTVEVAWSSAGQAFGAPVATWPGYHLRAAAIDPRDGGVVAGLAAPFQDFGRGVYVGRRPPAGPPSAPEALSPTDALGPLTVAPDGRTLLLTTAPLAPGTSGPALLVGAP